MKEKIIIFLFLTLYSLCAALYLETKTLKLRDQDVCQNEIEKYCPDSKLSNSILIACLQDNVPMENEMSSDCQILIWDIMKNITKGEGNYMPIKNYDLCSKDLDQIPNCKHEKDAKGAWVACLVEEIDKVQNAACASFLHSLQPLIFGNFRLIYQLTDLCSEDISKYNCGRSKKFLLAEQGNTLDCLSEHKEGLQAQCKEEVLKVAEQQGADWKLNRGLFLACRDDQLTFCPPPMDGAHVYSCLLEKKENPGMSQKCKEKLRARQRLEAGDMKANYRFYHMCSTDIQKHKCYSLASSSSSSKKDGSDDDDDDDVDAGKVVGGVDAASWNESHEIKLSSVLLCLEKASAKGHLLRSECINEMVLMRSQMIADHRVNPALLEACHAEVELCEDPKKVASLHSQGLLSSATHHYIVHCIMDLTRHTFMRKQVSDAYVSSKCYFAVSSLLKHVDVIDNLDIDPAFKYDCAIASRKYCNVARGEGNLISCMMGLLGTEKIDAECSNRLLEIQFFAARDFKLSATFWATCATDVERLCLSSHLGTQKEHAKSGGEDGDVKVTRKAREQASIVSCLYRNSKNNVSQACNKHVQMLLEEKAKSADLPPELQQACITDLSRFCDKLDRDDGMGCLEEHYDSLSEECQKQVATVVEEEEDVPLITRLFLDSCETFWQQHCENVKNNGKQRDSFLDGIEGTSEDSKDTEEDAVLLMECLIKNKNHRDMPQKCRAGIEHHQLVSLKHFNASHHLKRACSQDILDHCDDLPSKAAVIKCLSERVYNDTMLDSKHHVSKKCRKLLTFEGLQMRETMNLDDEVRAACHKDRKRLCNGIKPGKGAALQCLREHQEELTDACRKLIFQREKEEAANPGMDFTLVSKCKHMIEVHCNDDEGDLFACLKASRDEEGFDHECRKVLVDRLRLRAKDIRLNPQLMRDCHSDIDKHCHKAVESVKEKPFEAEGVVIYCLRMAFVHKIKRKHMTDTCVRHITDMLKDSALDDLQDASLVKHCSEAIKEKCVEEATKDKLEFGGTRVEGCLKQHLMEDEAFRERHVPCFHEIIQRMSESKVDIQVDPLLQRVCSLDTQTVCKGVVSGEGRVMSCLLMALNQNSNGLSEGCREALKARTELWNKAVVLSPPENVGELMSHIHASPARIFLELVLFAGIVFIFCGGLCCGRVTKRMSQQAKSK